MKIASLYRISKSHAASAVQFILDMEFLTLVAKNGGFLSRTVRQVIADQQEKMEQAYAATGADLSRSVFCFDSRTYLNTYTPSSAKRLGRGILDIFQKNISQLRLGPALVSKRPVCRINMSSLHPRVGFFFF